MQNRNLLPGAIILLALGLFANAAVALLGHGNSVQGAASQFTSAAPQYQGNAPDQSGIIYLGRDTYFMTHGNDGKQVYVWYYDYNPIRGDNKVEFVTSAAVR